MVVIRTGADESLNCRSSAAIDTGDVRRLWRPAAASATESNSVVVKPTAKWQDG